MACLRATFWVSSEHLLVLLAPDARLILDSLEHARCLLCLGATSWVRVPAVAAAMTCISMLKQAAGRKVPGPCSGRPSTADVHCYLSVQDQPCSGQKALPCARGVCPYNVPTCMGDVWVADLAGMSPPATNRDVCGCSLSWPAGCCRYGYRGFYDRKSKPVVLTKKVVEGIQLQGGTILGTSRGGADIK